MVRARFKRRAVTGAAGTYSVVVPPGTFTVKAIKAGFVTMPAPQTRTVAVGDTATLGDFTATPSTISGTLVNATTGAAIYNGVVQVGGKGGPAMVTDQTGAYITRPPVAAGSNSSPMRWASIAETSCSPMLATSRSRSP